MNRYTYLDIESYHPTIDLKRDYEAYKLNAEPITIQLQEIDIITGLPNTDLEVITKWENPDMLERFGKLLDRSQALRRIFIGLNPKDFDFPILKNALDRKNIRPNYNFKSPFAFDLRGIRVFQNKGMLTKDYLVWGPDNHDGDKIKTWYETKQYSLITNYLKNENEQFLKWFQDILKALPKPNI